MNKENTPIKYHLSMWKSLPGYPTSNDFLYEVLTYLEKNAKTQDFSEQTLTYAIGPNWRDTHKGILEALVSNGTVQKDTKGDKQVYRVVANPFD